MATTSTDPDDWLNRWLERWSDLAQGIDFQSLDYLADFPEHKKTCSPPPTWSNARITQPANILARSRYRLTRLDKFHEVQTRKPVAEEEQETAYNTVLWGDADRQWVEGRIKEEHIEDGQLYEAEERMPNAYERMSGIVLGIPARLDMADDVARLSTLFYALARLLMRLDD